MGQKGEHDVFEIALAAVDEALLELLPNDSWKLLDTMMQARPIEVGEPANITVFDPDLEWTVVPGQLAAICSAIARRSCGSPAIRASSVEISSAKVNRKENSSIRTVDDGQEEAGSLKSLALVLDKGIDPRFE